MLGVEIFIWYKSIEDNVIGFLRIVEINFFCKEMSFVLCKSFGSIKLDCDIIEIYM